MSIGITVPHYILTDKFSIRLDTHLRRQHKQRSKRHLFVQQLLTSNITITTTTTDIIIPKTPAIPIPIPIPKSHTLPPRTPTLRLWHQILSFSTITTAKITTLPVTKITTLIITTTTTLTATATPTHQIPL
jgi:hypothetical protein